MEKLRQMQENRFKLDDMEYIDPFEYKQNITGVVTYVAALAEVGEKILKQGNTGSTASVMGSAYAILREEIESRYANPDYNPAIVIEEDGVTAHLMTKEEEIALLDKAYENVAEAHAYSKKYMAQFQGKHNIADEIYERTKREYMAEKERRYMERLKQKVDSISDSILDSGSRIFFHR